LATRKVHFSKMSGKTVRLKWLKHVCALFNRRSSVRCGMATVFFVQPLFINFKATMSLDKVTPGKNAPESFNVIIEIPMNADPVKYEVDKESGAIFVDRFMSTAMHYPCNYGYVPQTLSGDGDPVDVLVITPVPLISGVVVTCRVIGILKMTDEAGEDGKVLAVPIDKKCALYTHWQKPEDMNPLRLKTIAHFFEHYKDLEEGKWVKVAGWEGPDAAKKEIADGMANYANEQKAK